MVRNYQPGSADASVDARWLLETKNSESQDSNPRGEEALLRSIEKRRRSSARDHIDSHHRASPQQSQTRQECKNDDADDDLDGGEGVPLYPFIPILQLSLDSRHVARLDCIFLNLAIAYCSRR